MEPDLPPRFAIATFCDDVRVEVGNKLSFIGIYQSDLLVPTFPTTLPKLCVVMMVRTPLTRPFRELRFDLLRNEEVLVSSASDPKQLEQVTPDAGSGERYWGAMFVGAVAPFQINEPFKLRTRVTTESEILKGGALEIKQVTPAMLAAMRNPIERPLAAG
jgi:hypothetical protein